MAGIRLSFVLFVLFAFLIAFATTTNANLTFNHVAQRNIFSISGKISTSTQYLSASHEFISKLFPINKLSIDTFYVGTNKTLVDFAEDTKTHQSVCSTTLEQLEQMVTHSDKNHDGKVKVIIAEPDNLVQFQQTLSWMSTKLRKDKIIGKLFIKYPIIQAANYSEMGSEFLLQFANLFELTDHTFVIVVSHSNNLINSIENPEGQFSFSLWEIYSAKSKLFVTNLSKLLEIDRILSRRQNLENIIIRGMSPIDPSYKRLVRMIRPNKGELEFADGYVVNVLRDLRDSLNFRVKAVEATDYVGQGPNNTILGMGKQIEDGEADLAVSLAYFIGYRARHFDYLHPVSNIRVMAFFRQPDRPHSPINNFIKPFSKKLWVGIIVTTWLVTICLHFILNFEATISDKWFSNDIFLWIFGTLCQQGWYSKPSSLSIQIIFWSGFIMGIVVFSAYCASIISALTSTRTPISSIEALLNLDYNIISDSGVQLETFLETSTNKKHVQNLVKYFSNDESETMGVELALQGEHTILLTLDGFYTSARQLLLNKSKNNENEYDVDKILCETISYVPITNVIIKSGMFVPKRSPFKDLFNFKLLMIMERGLNSRYMHRLLEESTPTCSDHEILSQRNELGLWDLITPFLILGFGWIVSLAVLGLELCVWKYKDIFKRARKLIISPNLY